MITWILSQLNKDNFMDIISSIIEATFIILEEGILAYFRHSQYQSSDKSTNNFFCLYVSYFSVFTSEFNFPKNLC